MAEQNKSIGSKAVSANKGSCKLLWGGSQWSPVSHHQSPGAGVHGAGCSPMGLPYKGGPIKRPLHISIYKAHQRDEQQRG